MKNLNDILQDSKDKLGKRIIKYFLLKKKEQELNKKIKQKIKSI